MRSIFRSGLTKRWSREYMDLDTRSKSNASWSSLLLGLYLMEAWRRMGGSMPQVKFRTSTSFR